MFIELMSEDQGRLSALAAETKQTEAQVTQEIMHWFLLSREENFSAAVAAGDDDFERGNFFAHEEVVAMFRDVLEPN